MRTIDDIRRENLGTLLDVECAGNQAEMARRLGGKDPNQINQWLGRVKGTVRNISPRSARAVEIAFSKPNGWLDSDHRFEESPSSSQSVGLQRSIVAAAVRLTAYVREVSIEDIPDDLYPEVLYQAMQVVARRGVDSIDNGAGIANAAKEVAAAIRAR